MLISLDRYHLLDKQGTLSDNLRLRTVVEFPELFVVLSAKLSSYPLWPGLPHNYHYLIQGRSHTLHVWDTHTSLFSRPRNLEYDDLMHSWFSVQRVGKAPGAHLSLGWVRGVALRRIGMGARLQLRVRCELVHYPNCTLSLEWCGLGTSVWEQESNPLCV